MHFVDLSGRISLIHALLGKITGVVTLAWAGLLASGMPVGAQQLTPAEAPKPASATSAPASTALPQVRVTPTFAPSWSALTTRQQSSLAPLVKSWDTLSDGHRRKWIALAKNYPSMAPAEQEKLHSRMAEWAALSPRDRELARLNFVETKKLAPPDRASNWEAYQALTPEERKKLRRKATTKPTGAAISTKPAQLDKLAVVPTKRNAAQPVRGLSIPKHLIHPYTLLPLPPQPPAAPPASESN